MTRQTLTLPFGEGLDRKTGSAVVDPRRFGTLKNVRLYDGRMELRPGLARKINIGWGTDIVEIFSLRGRGVSAVLVYDLPTNVVRLYTWNGTTATLVGTLWTMPAGVTSRPRVLGADLYGKLVLAHDEPSMTLRQATKILTVATSSLSTYTADLDRDGSADPVKFRGVTRHLSYLVGWGYGTDSDEDRPEVLRISKAGEPTTLVAEHYFIVGDQGDPIIGCGKSGRVLMIAKASEAYKLLGHDRPTFGVVPMDDSHGLLVSRLHVTVGDENFRWGLKGPRVSTGEQSLDLELPLDLEGPDPDELLSATESENGFAFYDPAAEEVVFVFDYFGYVLHLKDRNRRWSYRPYQYALSCGALVYEGGTTTLTVVAEPPAWVMRTAPQDKSWNAVAFSPTLGANGRLVAVSAAGFAMYSDDGGLTWTNGTIANRAWNAVCWAGGSIAKFVAVASTGTGDRTAYSADGITFTLGTSAADNAWEGVVYADGLGMVVAVASSGVGNRVMTSTNGTSFTIQTSAADNLWDAIAWSEELGKLVAVARSGTDRVMTSTNGTSWASQSSPSEEWRAIDYSPEKNLFVAVGNANAGTAAKIMTSVDGAGGSWTARVAPTGAGALRGVVWAGDRTLFMTVASSGTTTQQSASSTDGISWSARDVPVARSWRALAYAAGTLDPKRFVAVADDGGTDQVVMTAP